MKFTVIIPHHKADPLDLQRAINSASTENSELAVVEDADGRGAGYARNAGLDLAGGDWVIFLDSDDMLLPGWDTRLLKFIEGHPDADVIGYGWDWLCSPEMGIMNRRTDADCLRMSDLGLISEYLKFHMDGSVIFTAMKRSVIGDVRFREGYHEDVDFLFNIYMRAASVEYLDEVLYIKQDRPDAITRTISTRHLDGMVEAWKSIGSKLTARWADQYHEGTINMVATRVREIPRRANGDPQAIMALTAHLYAILPDEWLDWCASDRLQTQYGKIARKFALLQSFEPTDFTKTWSCTDLQGSVFLAPDEVRTCCKRFFRGGEMRGDVKLLDAKPVVLTSRKEEGQVEETSLPVSITLDGIIEAKKKLITEINKGHETPCSGCPFMEFKEWEPIRLKYLSLEQHSVCNMKCSYCDDTYYGGKQPRYDVPALVKDIINQGLPSGMKAGDPARVTVVWGGGEPTVGRDFENLSKRLEMALPRVKQRVLTNALKHSAVLQELVDTGRATIVTSIDAGTQKTFTKVRGMGSLTKVISNLERYAAVNPQAVTVKYILTEDNHSHDEVIAFVKWMKQSALTKCNFQISGDFKQERMSSEQIRAAIDLVNGLAGEVGCVVVYWDDLLYQRLVKSDWERLPLRWEWNFPSHEHSIIAVVGEGAMADWLIEHLPALQGKEIVRYHTHHDLLHGVPVLIAGSQTYPDNYRKALAMGVPEHLIIRGVVI